MLTNGLITMIGMSSIHSFQNFSFSLGQYPQIVFKNKMFIFFLGGVKVWNGEVRLVSNFGNSGFQFEIRPLG